MDPTAAFSFCYTSPELEQGKILDDDDNNNNATSLEWSDVRCRVSATVRHNSLLETNRFPPINNQCICISGPLASAKAARQHRLMRNPKIKAILKIPVCDCPAAKVPILQEKAIPIEADTGTRIRFLAPQPSRPRTFASENTMTIEIIGRPEPVERARVRVLVLLDEMASQLLSDVVCIPIKLQNLICGRKRTGLQLIMEETSTNIYFPSAFDCTGAKADADAPVYITGEPGQVSRVKDMLLKLAQQKAKSMYHKDSTLHPRKLDWLQLHRRDELRRLMRDNGSFVVLPLLGSDEARVTVYAESRVNAERTLRSLNFLACDVYEATFCFDSVDRSIFCSLDDVAALVEDLARVSNAEVSYQSSAPGCIDVIGSEHAVHTVYQRLLEMRFANIHRDTLFRVELSNDQREFISGKKSGKINKIMKTSGAKIKFQQLENSEYNFIIEVESHSFTEAIKGLTMLQEELPAEISFFVPEAYHKRIIGVGGKNIQRIMKKYGVYVKFSNAEEFAALGGYYDNDDNVVARTPMKNKENLDNLRVAVMELLGPKDKDLVTELVEIPFRSHLVLRRDHMQTLSDAVKKTNTRIQWPDCELASDMVELVGPQAQIQMAKDALYSCVPEVYEFRAPISIQLDTYLNDERFREEVVHRLERDFAIRVDTGSSGSPPTPPMSTSPPANAHSTKDHVIRLRLTKAGRELLPKALSLLIGFLRDHHVPLYDEATTTSDIRYPGGAISKSDSFSHFGSRVLAASPPAGLSPYAHPFSHAQQASGYGSYSLFGNPRDIGALDTTWKPFSEINSPSIHSPRTAENIRAIFDSPSSPDSSMERVMMPLSQAGFVSSANGNKDIWTNSQRNAFLPTQTTTMTTPSLSESHGGLSGMPMATATPGGVYPLRPNTYVGPTSSTSTGSNSSRQSSQSMPDVILDQTGPRRHPDDTSSSTLPTPMRSSKSSSLVMNTQTHPLPPLEYTPPSTTAFSLSSSSSSASQPLPDKSASSDYTLFAPHSTDEARLVQSLLNSMSLEH